MPYTSYETPFGRGWIVHAGRLVELVLPGGGEPDREPPHDPPPAIRRLAGQLERYWNGEGPLPDGVDLAAAAGTTDLMRRIYRTVAAIPAGRTMTYREVAEAAGAPQAARAVGAAMARNRFAPVIPCHRVVGSDGSLRGYAGGLAMKRYLLAMERSRG